MDTKKRKPITELNETLKRLRKKPADPRILEKFNDLMRKDEEADEEERRKESERRRKIARPPETELISGSRRSIFSV